MFVSKAEYRVKADFAARNLQNIKTFLPMVQDRLRPGSSYSVSVSDDGQSFVHIFFHQNSQDTEVLAEIPEFHQFLREVMEGCEAPPQMAMFSEI